MKVKKTLGALAAASGLLLALAGSAGIVQAQAAYDSPHAVDSDTTQLNWSGQGWDGGTSFDSKCGDNADPGSGGFQNGADANNYLLWIFNTSNGSASGATLWIDGTSYGSGDGHQIVTPGLDPGSISDAHMSFSVDSTGNGAWTLVISHGCIAETSSTTSFTSSESSESTTTTTTSTTSFTSSESSESTTTLPNTATIGNTGSSGMSNGLWMLLAGIGVVGGSVLVLMPARAKGKR